MKTNLPFLVFTISILLGIVPAGAIPGNIQPPPQDKPASAPSASATPDLATDALFTRSQPHDTAVQAPDSQPDATLHQKSFKPWGSDTNAFKSLGRYSQGTEETDPAGADKTTGSSGPRPEVRPDGSLDPFMADLRPPDPNAGAEAEALKQAVRKATVQAAEAASASRQRVHGWGDLVLCLVGIALVILAFIARR